ncbi:MAG: PAS domain S-box protein [Dehalococcoidia bacterium]|jgi:PAS domain S-box-containing protein
MGISHLRGYRGQFPELRNPHLWIIIVLFVLLTMSHLTHLLLQIPVLGDISIPGTLELSRHSLERLLYLMLVLYAGWTLGTIGGGALWLSSAAAMLLRTFLISPHFQDALLESFASLVIGALAITLMAAHHHNRRQQAELEKAVRDLELARQNYEDLFANASDAVWVHDMDGNIILANKACERLTGYSISELAGQNVSRFIPPETLPLLRQVRDRLLKGEAMEHRYEHRLTRKDGSEAIVQLASRLIVSNGKPQAFQHLARDITEQRRLQDNLQFYLRQVLQAQEEERKRLARELHDDTSQQVLLLTHGVDNLASKAESYLPQELRNELGKLYELSEQTYQGVKRYAQALRPRILDDLGLVPAIKWLAEEIHNFSGIKIQVKTDKIPPLAPETQLVLFRIVQEALNNVHRHSGASEANVNVERQGNDVTVTISDNGKGFNLPQQLSDFAGRGKLGLTGMAERARLIGGELQVSSQIGKGTELTVRAPIVLHNQIDS